MAVTTPGELSSVAGGAFAGGLGLEASSGASQQLDFYSELGAELLLTLVPIIQLDLESDPGDTMAAGARYVIDDLSTPDEDYTIQFIELSGRDPELSSQGSIGFGDIEFDPRGVITGVGGADLTVPISVAAGGPDVLANWEFRFETFATAIAPAGEVPVPAALPLLASALGGLVWMRRRRPA
jgi:hypothetical protein